MKISIYILKKITFFVSLLTIFMVMVALGSYLYSAPQLPEIASLKNIQLQTPMRIYTADDKLMGEFGDVRRIPVTREQIPQNFINALIATEDQRFYKHSGVDVKGLFRVIKVALFEQGFSEGASTLTMQTARNMFLNRDRSLQRKLVEMFLAINMEKELTKDEILTLYSNKVHFSHRAYGLGAAAQVYYGKDLTELSLPQAAMMAGLLKGESVYNPISNPSRAITRRNLVLKRMSENKGLDGEFYISPEDYQAALETPLSAKKHSADLEVSAPYVAEMVRLKVIEQFGREQAYSEGLVIHTTIDATQQMFANQALHQGLVDYDKRHGYKGSELVLENFDASLFADLATNLQLADSPIHAYSQLLADTPSIAGLEPAIVVELQEQSISIFTKAGTLETIEWDSLKWAAKFISDSRIGNKPKAAEEILSVGSLIRVAKQPIFEEETENVTSETIVNEDLANDADSEETPQEPTIQHYQWQLAQIPEASSGFVALAPKNGAVTALVGGFDYLTNKFNLVTQARRQPGSNIKPFIYAAALAKGYTPASLVNDAPFIKVNEAIDEVWRPQNDNLKYNGPTRLRVGLKKSINTISTRLIDSIGAAYAEDYLVQIGLPDEHMDPYQSLALGTASFTPMEMAMAYAVLANGGYQVNPYYIDTVTSVDGEVLYQATPQTVCKECADLIAQYEANKAKATTDDIEVNSIEPLEPIENTDLTASLEDSAQNEINSEDVITVSEYDSFLPIPEAQIAQSVMDPRDAFIIYDMMKDVIKSGTATATLRRRNSNLLGRNDIAGKTGTANDYKDAWFSGYNRELVASAWVGFSDHRRSLGKFEYGGKAALPIWANFMEQVLANAEEKAIYQPPGVVSAKIDPVSGKLAALGQTNSIFEYFRNDNVPTEVAVIETDFDAIYNESSLDQMIDGLDNPLDEPSDEEPEEDGDIF